MVDSCREPICKTCIHGSVCVYKDIYLEMTEILRNTFDESPKLGNIVSINKLSESLNKPRKEYTSFMTFRDPDCKFCGNRKEPNIR